MFTDNTSGNIPNSIKEFASANSLISKFAFILLVLLVFSILLRLAIGLLSAYFSPSGTPKLFVGMVPGNMTITFDQTPGGTGINGKTKNQTIIRSDNQRGGIEFTWSLWVFLQDDVTAKEYRHIFSKGNPEQYARSYTPGVKSTQNGIMGPNNGPGLYVAPGTNTLLLIMNTFENIDEEIEINNMPMNKWVSVIIRVKNENLDIFINGIITKNMQFTNPPRQNYENVQLHLNGGYNGYTSNLWYYNYALGTNAINSIVYWGPNTTLAVDNGLTTNDSDYLSSKWYFGGQGDMYNPTTSQQNY